MAKDIDSEPTLDDIEPEECWSLLSQRCVGRLAVAVPGSAPLVIPVNYVVDRQAIVFRSGAGEKVDSLHHHPVSFEIDEIDPFHHTGWSVLVKGRAYEALHREVDHLTIEPWAPGRKGRWIRLVPSSITGRRINLAPFEADPRAYL